MHQLVDHIAWEHALGAISNVNLILEFGALAEDEFSHQLRRAYGGGGLDDKEVTFLQERECCAGGSLYIGYVGLMISLEWGGDDDEVRVTDLGACLGMHLSRTYDLLQKLL